MTQLNSASGPPTPGKSPYAEFLNAAQTAKNETSIRELFVILAAKGFSEEEFAQSLALGAEYSVAFSKRGLIRRGRIDSFVDNVLVEFKAKLRSPEAQESARAQLAAYVAGAWAVDDSYRRPYIAVATDGLTWQIYAATAESKSIPPAVAAVDNVMLTAIDEWPGPSGERDPEMLRQFLDRVFFRHTLLRPTSENFARDFGLSSAAFVTTAADLERKARTLANDPQMRLYEASWWSDLQVSYGAIDDTGLLFIRHTYLALLARLLVWATLERRPATSKDLKQVFDRSYFVGRRIGNLVEDDYFAWHNMPSDIDLTPAWTALVGQLATYQLDDISEDVLKPLYEQLVDPETRHDLGEYYTPDWLAEEVVERLLSSWTHDQQPRILDPACGSGSFLRASIHHIRSRQSNDSDASTRLTEILSSVHGMDVNPLASTIAKATYLLAISDLLPQVKTIINIPVYLCNSLSGERPGKTMSLMGDLVELHVGHGQDRRAYLVPIEFISDSATYDYAIGEAIAISRSTGSSKTAAKLTGPALRIRLSKRLAEFPQADVLLNSLSEMVIYLTELVKRRQDTIYGFLLRNQYRSVLLRDHFDLIVGNPPWLTVADIRAGEYRDLVLQRNADLRIAPRAAGDQAHTEIATIFLAQVTTQFLREREGDDPAVPRVGFVLPRSVFSASHHAILREGSYRARFNITEVWDLDDVIPLFSIPACVVFASAEAARPANLKMGRIYHGRFPGRDPSVKAAKSRLTTEDVDFALRHLGKRSAWSRVGESSGGVSDAERLAALVNAKGFKARHYSGMFRQGAVLYPQVLFIVDQVNAGWPITVGEVAVATNPVAARGAKLLKDFRWQQVVDAETLVYTAAAEHIVPYAIREPLWTAVLPVIESIADREFQPVDSDKLRESGYVHTADWLEMAENQWESVRKEGATTPLWKRLDHLGQLTGQAERERWIVLYTASAGRIVSTVLDTAGLDREFVARDKTYWCALRDEDEAHYLAAFLNSDLSHEMMADFVTRGLFGARDIHKRVLDLPWPRYDSSNANHVKLASLARKAAGDAREFLHGMDPATPRPRGAVRSAINKDYLREIGELVIAVSEMAI